MRACVGLCGLGEGQVHGAVDLLTCLHPCIKTCPGKIADANRRLLMTLQYIPYTRSKSSVRRTRELETVRVMVRLYCRGYGHHGAHERSDALCADCGTLMEYATRRLARCVFGDAKPTRANFVVNCYSAARREQGSYGDALGGAAHVVAPPAARYQASARRAATGAGVAGAASGKAC